MAETTARGEAHARNRSHHAMAPATVWQERLHLGSTVHCPMISALLPMLAGSS